MGVEFDMLQLFAIAVAVLTPVYAYMYQINQKISGFASIVANCPYCNRKLELIDLTKEKR